MSYIHEHNNIRLFASSALREKMLHDGSLTQAQHATTLPNLVGPIIILPDAHLGYGFPVGTVAATTGFISPGAIGFDINCGVRLLVTNATYKDLQPILQTIMDALFKAVPTGVGTESSIRLTHEQLDSVLVGGAKQAVRMGYGTEDDCTYCENEGCIAGADPTKVSPTAKKRGKNQLGTLGAGNHFLEIQRISDIFDADTAHAFGLHKDHVAVMIHCGSRGLGHQICSEYLRLFEDTYPEIAQQLPEKDLMYAPLTSSVAHDYIAAMHCAMNFAWANRHVIGHHVRNVFAQHDIAVRTVYDLGHNNAKQETHHNTRAWVHRKGAARAFPAGHKELSTYKKTGHPVLVPGSMGTSSYVLVGTQQAMDISLGSCCHGAGRVMSRRQASATFTHKQIVQELADKQIVVQTKSKKGIVDEAPQVYKNVDEVITICERAGITKTVAKLVPLGVIKG